MQSFFTQGPLEHTYVFHRHKNLNRSGKVYLILLISVIASLLAIPWIQIESVTTSPGLISPPGDPFEIRVKEAGLLQLSGLAENEFVYQGDTLFTIWRKSRNQKMFAVAPTDGYVRNLRNSADQLSVTAGEVILEILPEPDLVVKCYLSGDDITSVQPDQDVEFQVQSSQKPINGVLSGTVTKISPSPDMKDENALFEVSCSIDTTKQNSGASRLKAGMTLLARFRSARRSAFDIILKDVEDKDRNPT